MSRSLNKVTLIGHVGADPEVRSVAGGGKVAKFSVATGRQWQGANGESQEKTEWHSCVAWNHSPSDDGLASVVERYVRKGHRLFVEGRVEYREYTDKQQLRHLTEIKVREIILLSPRYRAEESVRPEPAEPVSSVQRA